MGPEEIDAGVTNVRNLLDETRKEVYRDLNPWYMRNTTAQRALAPAPSVFRSLVPTKVNHHVPTATIRYSKYADLARALPRADEGATGERQDPLRKVAPDQGLPES